MKKIIPVLILVFLVTGFYSCTKESDDTSALCNNSIKDGNESEIDCGGACTPCPDKGTFSCNITGVPPLAASSLYVSNNAAGQVLTPSIRVYGTNQNNSPLNFMFIPSVLNQLLPISASNFDFVGEPFIKTSGDTGSVVLTYHDTLRHIISGTFSYGAQRVTQSFTKCTVTEGVFTNVRYHCNSCTPPY